MTYKYKVDKSLLDQFFLSYPQEPTIAQLEEVKKVLNVVMIKHFSSYISNMDDLRSYALLAVLERRSQYDPSYSSYNYIYSIFRNEVGNKINKLTKENFVEDILKFKEALYESNEAELPKEISRYKKYLTGEEEFSLLRIPKKDALNLIVFMKIYESSRETKVPEFIEPNNKSIQVLYKLLKQLFDDEI